MDKMCIRQQNDFEKSDDFSNFVTPFKVERPLEKARHFSPVAFLISTGISLIFRGVGVLHFKSDEHHSTAKDCGKA